MSTKKFDPMEAALRQVEASARRSSEAKPWEQLVWRIAEALKCLPSSFVDENDHILKKAKALQAQADSLASAGGVEDDWLPIALAQEDELCIVFWRDESTPEHPERYEFDHLEDGAWFHHSESYDRYMMVGASLGPGPSEKAPYTHFKRLHAPGAQSALSKEREVADGLAEALRGYMAAVDLMNAAMKDGINVHGAISGLIGWTDNAEFALTAHRESRGAAIEAKEG